MLFGLALESGEEGLLASIVHFSLVDTYSADQSAFASSFSDEVLTHRRKESDLERGNVGPRTIWNKRGLTEAPAEWTEVVVV